MSDKEQVTKIIVASTPSEVIQQVKDLTITVEACGETDFKVRPKKLAIIIQDRTIYDSRTGYSLIDELKRIEDITPEIKVIDQSIDEEPHLRFKIIEITAHAYEIFCFVKVLS